MGIIIKLSILAVNYPRLLMATFSRKRLKELLQKTPEAVQTFRYWGLLGKR